MRREAYYYVTAVASLAALFCLAISWQGAGEFVTSHFGSFAAFFVLGLVAQVISSEFAASSSGRGTRAARSSLLFIPMFACAVVFPPFAVVLTIAAIQLATELRQSRVLWRIVFNVSQHVLTYGAASWAFHHVRDSFAAGSAAEITLPDALAFVAMVTVALAINQLLVGLFIAIRHQESIPSVLQRTAGAGGANLFFDLLASPLAIVAIILYRGIGAWGLVVGLLPLFLFRHSYQDSQRLQQVNKDLLYVLVKTIEMRDPYTSGHSIRVATIARAIAEDLRLGKREIDNIETAATLHDVGKIDPIYAPLISKPFSLSHEEVQLIRTHAARGAEILSSLTSLPKEVTLAVLHHHERYDGTGYPSGLSGKEIPIAARVIMMADSVDAMLSDRPYRSALSLDEVKRELMLGAGTQFDAEIVRAVVGSDAVERAAASASLAVGSDPYGLPV
jgi:putative nucleotidyltransferase with HDIG domain